MEAIASRLEAIATSNKKLLVEFSLNHYFFQSQENQATRLLWKVILTRRPEILPTKGRSAGQNQFTGHWSQRIRETSPSKSKQPQAELTSARAPGPQGLTLT